MDDHRNRLFGIACLIAALALTPAADAQNNGYNRRPQNAAALNRVAQQRWLPQRFDVTRFPQDRQRLAQPDLRRDFPRLNGDYQVLEPAGRNYNCVAHTLGITNRWIDPVTGPANAPLAPMDRLYGQHGYQRLPALDLTPVPGVQKVVLYATAARNGSISQVTHAALQLPDGTFASKLGPLALIRHGTPQALVGPAYGAPVAVYARAVR